MSWSLELRNGDLTVNAAKLGTVTGQQKLVQDLRCCILEKMGHDPLHPEFGSTLDGGTEVDGLYNPGVIGETNIDFVILEVESELTRIMKDHQNKQLIRAKEDRVRYGKATLTPQEVLFSLNSVDIEQNQDSLNAVVHLSTGTGDELSLTIPLSDEILLNQ